jgi:hypothetical protein
LSTLRPLRNHLATIRSHVVAISFFCRLIGQTSGFEADVTVELYLRAYGDREPLLSLRQNVRKPGPRRRSA